MTPSCPVEKRCGACRSLAVAYGDQLAEKQASIRELFSAIASDSDETRFLPIVGMAKPYHYRNKVVSPYVPGKRIGSSAAKRGSSRAAHSRKKGDTRVPARREILCGMYERGTHRVIPTDECLIENEAAKRIILTIRDIMPAHRIEPYNENNGRGFLRHAIVRVGHQSGEILVTLVTNGENFPGAKKFCRDLVKRCPEITTIVQNVNTRNTNVILGDGKERTLYGPGFILDKLCGLSFRISSHSFYQVNAVQTEVLYERAIELANLQGGERILDAYCGTGTIGLVAARKLSELNETDRICAGAGVTGVDKVAAAIVDARNNAKHNGIDNARFVAEDAGEFMSAEAARGEHYDVVFMDPPRAGASESFLAALARLAPERIVYISCNPKTQVRDCSFLLEHGYELAVVQPVDMFPHTDHIENITVLARC